MEDAVVARSRRRAFLDWEVWRLADERAAREAQHAAWLAMMDERIAVLSDESVPDPLQRYLTKAADAQAYLIKVAANHMIATRLLTDAIIRSSASDAASNVDGVIVGTLDGARIVVLVDARRDMDAQTCKDAWARLGRAKVRWEAAHRRDPERDPDDDRVWFAFAACRFTAQAEAWIRALILDEPWIRVDMNPRRGAMGVRVVEGAPPSQRAAAAATGSRALSSNDAPNVAQGATSVDSYGEMTAFGSHGGGRGPRAYHGSDASSSSEDDA